VLHDAALESRLVEQFVQVVSGALRRAQAFSDAVDANRELRRLQAQVIQAEKLASLGQIVAGVVHELNNPLTSIVAYSDYLLKRSAERGADPDDLERLRRIGEAAERILKFSRDLVAYARPSAEVAGPVHLHEVIDKALVFCEHELGERQVNIERRMGEHLPPVLGIAGQLTQVFVNLFTNASHAMNPGGGCLRVETRLEGQMECIVVEVSDDGIGIEPGDLVRIFEPFFTTKSDGLGTGLGLSIVRDIVDAHGGQLVCRSELGRGTTFAITLPAVASKKSTRPPPAG
jgi:signal transduction histidine kinase